MLVKVSAEVADGSPAHVILEIARSHDVTVIAMSTHGRSGLGRVVFGSVSDAVVRNSHLPVLLIRPEEETEAKPSGAT